MGGSVIWLDIPRDTVSIVCNIKSIRGHTSIHLTPWESRAQYKKWNQKTYKPHDKASNLIDRFHATERRASSIWQSRWLSLYCVVGCTHPKEVAPTEDIQLKTMHIMMRRTGQDR